MKHQIHHLVIVNYFIYLTSFIVYMGANAGVGAGQYNTFNNPTTLLAVMVFTLPAELQRREATLLDAFDELHETHEGDGPLESEDLARDVVDYLLLFVEHVARHIDNYKPEDWQAALVDFSQDMTYQGEDGLFSSFLNLPEGDLDEAIAECCSLEDTDERTPVERLAALRDFLLELRVRFDEMALG